MHSIEQAIPAMHRPHVIIVEDEPISRRALAAIMVAEGYRTSAYTCAEDALTSEGHHGGPCVVLADLNLPGMSGIEFIHRMGDFDRAIFPVLITAAGGAEFDDAQSDENITCFRKPLDVKRLLDLLGERRPVD